MSGALLSFITEQGKRYNTSLPAFCALLPCLFPSPPSLLCRPVPEPSLLWMLFLLSAMEQVAAQFNVFRPVFELFVGSFMQLLVHRIPFLLSVRVGSSQALGMALAPAS